VLFIIVSILITLHLSPAHNVSFLCCLFKRCVSPRINRTHLRTHRVLICLYRVLVQSGREPYSAELSVLKQGQQQQQKAYPLHIVISLSNFVTAAHY
jgi:hypothetical protein